jgi:hypothetical protein
VTCPSAADHGGFLGACQVEHQLTYLSPPAATTSNLIVVPAGVPFEDRSNNNPCDCGTVLKLEGFRGLIVKANQGVWIDPSGAAMVKSVRAAGLAVGVYDFDATYTLSEARTLITAAKRDGLTPKRSGEFPLVLDIEYGQATLARVEAQLLFLRQQGWRVAIYTGEWFWTPHMGINWPAATPAWLSGYPSVIPVPGLPKSLYLMHQWTDAPADEDVYLGTIRAFDSFVGTPVPRPGPIPPAICWGRGAKPGSSLCAPIVARHTWLVERRNRWHQSYVRERCAALTKAQRRRNVRGCGTDLHWYALRRKQAVELRAKHTR